MRLVVSLTALFLASAATAQPVRAWYESNEDIAALLRPDRSLRIGATTNFVRLINPLDVTALAFIASRTPPVSLTLTPTPELASFLTSKTRPISEAGFIDLRDRAKPLLVHTDGRGVENRLEELRSFKINCQFVTREDCERLNDQLSALPGIGRFEAVRSSMPIQLVAVRYLSRVGRPVPLITLSNQLVLIDILPFDRPVLDRDTEPEASPGRAATELPRVCATAMGEIHWRTIPEDARTEFIRRFGAGGRPVADSIDHSARRLFTEAFVIAVFHPTTFESEPVETFELPGPRMPSPPTGELLERIRFVDALLDPIEEAFLSTIPDRSFDRPANADPDPK